MSVIGSLNLIVTIVMIKNSCFQKDEYLKIKKERKKERKGACSLNFNFLWKYFVIFFLLSNISFFNFISVKNEREIKKKNAC